MYIATWPSLKSSPMMAEIRQALKKKSVKGQPPISNKEANRTWREEVLGILSEDQKKQRKVERQKKSSR
ncbi:hypothetical protein EBU94_06305, partial [bacterium]|nr:hypothetical protein [bacterium]